MNRPESSENGGAATGVVLAIAENGGAATGVALAIAAAVGIAVVFGLCCCSSSTSSERRKTMKAPGKNGKTMYRDNFEEDPQNYFRNLRKK